MDQSSTATPDELQQAINNITNPGGDSSTDAIAAVENSVAAAAADSAPVDLGTPPAPVVPDMSAAGGVPMPDAPAAPTDSLMEPIRASYGDPDLDKVKAAALSDLRPIIEKIDVPVRKKFMIYKDIIEMNEDKACIEPAYNAAKAIEDEKERADALLFIVEVIDQLGLPKAA